MGYSYDRRGSVLSLDELRDAFDKLADRLAGVLSERTGLSWAKGATTDLAIASDLATVLSCRGTSGRVHFSMHVPYKFVGDGQAFGDRVPMEVSFQVVGTSRIKNYNTLTGMLGRLPVDWFLTSQVMADLAGK